MFSLMLFISEADLFNPSVPVSSTCITVAESGSPDDLALKYGLTSKDIVNATRDIIKKK